jgi:uroporphyrinogen decarboxylase
MANEKPLINVLRKKTVNSENKLLLKLAYVNEMREASIAETQVYSNVHADSRSTATSKFDTEVEFPKKFNKKIPFWFMRQAGRYLPEFREARKNTGTFLDLCFNPEMAAEVTIQPIRRFNPSAAIIFSDILVIPYALGMDLEFIEKSGPRLNQLKSASELKDVSVIPEKLDKSYQAISRTCSLLPNDTAMIGFSGAPWTLACYMIDGSSKNNFALALSHAENNSSFLDDVINILIDAVVVHLSAQVKAGAEVVQIFDSWAGHLQKGHLQMNHPQSEKLLEKLVLKPAEKICASFKKLHPDIPVIFFPKGAGNYYKNIAEYLNCEGLGVDYNIDLEWAVENLAPHKVLQGNLHPEIMAGDFTTLEQQTRKIISTWGAGDNNFIFNMGHGMLPHTPVENVIKIAEVIRSYE